MTERLPDHRGMLTGTRSPGGGWEQQSTNTAFDLVLRESDDLSDRGRRRRSREAQALIRPSTPSRCIGRADPGTEVPLPTRSLLRSSWAVGKTPDCVTPETAGFTKHRPPVRW